MDIRKEEIVQGFLFSTDRGRLDVPYVHRYLSQQSYWAQHVPVEIVQRSIDNALCFGIYDGARQVGFARLVTDYATFAYLADVFVDEAYRGRALSKNLLAFIDRIEELKGLRRWMLMTLDAQALYAQHGYKLVAHPDRCMERHQPDVYKKLI